MAAFRLAYPRDLVRLQAELPLRMREAEADRQFSVLCAVRAVHRLHREAMEIEPDKVEWVEPVLRHDNLQLMSTGDDERCAGFWADADPVDAAGRQDRAVRLHRDLEIARMQRIDQRPIHLQ